MTWSRYDRYCKDQYVAPEQPEEFPTKGVSTNSMSAQMSPLFFTWSGNMLSWYARNAAAQLNASGTTYYYCAIG